MEVKGTYGGGGFLIHDGFSGREPAFEEAVAAGLDFVAVDAGSTDCGPRHLGTEEGLIPEDALKLQLSYLLSLTIPRGIPLLIGSANVAGTRGGLLRFSRALAEVAQAAGHHFRAAFIDSELDKTYLRRKLSDGKIRPLHPMGQLTNGDIDRAEHVVAMMGTEPYVHALQGGATVIIGGRTSDPALFAAVPIWKGVPLAIAWHMAKVIDHGQTILELEPGHAHFEPGAPSWVIGVAAMDHFRVEASNMRGRCSAVRTAHTTLYENRSPTSFYEPPGNIDISQCRYEQVDPQTVRVVGSQLIPLEYTLKLEGAERIGFRAITMCGFRAPDLVANIDSRLDRLKRQVEAKAALQGIGAEAFRILFHVYGKDGVMGAWEPNKDFLPQEIFVLAECVADTQEMASHVGVILETALHILGGANFGGSFPYGAQVFEGGPVCKFTVWHLLEPGDAMECCRIDFVDY